MTMKRMRVFFVLFIFSFMWVFACTSPAPPVETPAPSPGETLAPQTPAPTVSPKPVEDEFDPATITREVFDSTKSDVQAFILDLNSIIRAKDYDAWAVHLGDEYFETISSRKFLDEKSNSPLLKKNRIVLKTPEDYFTHVVVPSRTNDRVDDIEFITPARVKAYTAGPNGNYLRLYDLENSDGVWKIVN